MLIPEGYTEAEVTKIIRRVVSSLAETFRFGYYEIEDIKQEGFVLAIELLNKGGFDASKPLDKYLFTHIRRRLINLKRDKFSRHEIPCKKCPFYSPDNSKSPWKNECEIFENKMDCEKWSKWVNRNESKKSLSTPHNSTIMSDDKIIDIPIIDESAIDVVNIAHLNEMKKIIIEKIPMEHRADFYRYIHGTTLSKTKKDKIRALLDDIFKEISGGEI